LAYCLSIAAGDDLLPGPGFLTGVLHVALGGDAPPAAGLAFTASPDLTAAAGQATTVISVFRPGNTALATDPALLAASLTLARSADGWSGVSVPVALPGQSGPSVVDAIMAGSAGASTGLAPQSASGLGSWGATADACFTDGDWMHDLEQDLRDRSRNEAGQSGDLPAERPEGDNGAGSASSTLGRDVKAD
jgi:hypothetical protein